MYRSQHFERKTSIKARQLKALSIFLFFSTGTVSKPFVVKVRLDDPAFLDEIASRLPKEWNKLGIMLGLADDALDAISIDDNRDAYERSYQVMLKWIEKFGQGATLQCLADALISIDRIDVAYQFELTGKF